MEKKLIFGIPVAFFLFIVVSVGAMVLLSYSYYNYVQETEIEKQSSENLRILKLEEENNLRSKLNEIIEQYDNARNEVDNLNFDLGDKQFEIDELKQEIRELLNVKNDLDLAREKIENLQDISKRYFAKVDSLLSKTEEQQEAIEILTLENDKIKDKNEHLNQENTDLSTLVDVGSYLQISDIEVLKIKFGTHDQERLVNRAKNIQVLRSCFKINANYISNKETKLVYIQYFSPSNNLLISSDTPTDANFILEDSLIHEKLLH